jgi:alkanesulfonate monooxygenase SsuD/methylene tetrahydromethanopterin reductase-like flavin-dependent oxidoreductase (luciferase family)
VGEVKIGALVWPQFTEWKSVKSMGVTADRVGFDTLWTWDHMYPIIGNPNGPMFEGWSTLVSWAENTSRIRIGLMVGANTFREPTITAKLATTLDHISNGRAILGVGAAWFEEEHEHFGLNFGDGFPERLRWLGEALPIMRGMLDGTEPTATGPRYKAKTVRNLPAPIQKHLPILIGGGGEQVTLKLVAKYGDANNVSGTPEQVAHKEEVLLKHCEAIGRDPKTIDRTVGIGNVVIRNDAAEALRIHTAQFGTNGISPVWENQPVGTVDQVVEHLAPYLKIGYRHLIAGFATPHDEESMIRFAEEVLPKLKQI